MPEMGHQEPTPWYPMTPRGLPPDETQVKVEEEEFAPPQWDGQPETLPEYQQCAESYYMEKQRRKSEEEQRAMFEQELYRPEDVVDEKKIDPDKEPPQWDGTSEGWEAFQNAAAAWRQLTDIKAGLAQHKAAVTRSRAAASSSSGRADGDDQWTEVMGASIPGTPYRTASRSGSGRVTPQV